MSVDIPPSPLFHMFADGISYQYGDQLTRVTRYAKVTYTLDQVTERGATFRVTTSAPRGTQKPDVSWVVVTPRHPQMRMCPTRKAVRAKIEV